MYPIKFLIAYNISGIWYEQINIYNVDLNTINLQDEDLDNDVEEE